MVSSQGTKAPQPSILDVHFHCPQLNINANTNIFFADKDGPSTPNKFYKFTFL